MTKQRIIDLIKIKKEIQDSVDLLALESLEKKVESDNFNFNEIVAISTLYDKYHYLVPYKFAFDPEKNMPRVFSNEKAFMVWTSWRSCHLLEKNQDLEKASLKAAEKAESYYPNTIGATYTEKQREEIFMEFYKHLNKRDFFYGSLPVSYDKVESDFWQKTLFPLLEREIEFRYETISNGKKPASV